MYYVNLVFLVSVSAREIAQIYNNNPSQERFERPPGPLDNFNSNNHRQNGFANTDNNEQFNVQNNRQYINNDRNHERPPPLERDHRNRPENVNSHNQNGFVNHNNPEPFNMQNNREFISNEYNNRDDRSRNPHENHDHIQINLKNPGELNTQRNREFIPNEGNNRNDRNWNPETNQGHPQANFHNHEQFNPQNNREFIPNENNRNDRYANAYPGHSHDSAGIMSINLAFERQGNQNRREQSNLNIPRQSFKINNEYSNRYDTNNSTSRNNNRNDKYNENILLARRQQDELTLEDYNKETHGSNHRINPPENQNNNGIVTFLNNFTNTNQNRDNQNPSRNHRTQSGLKQTDKSHKPKTAIENEVTQNPLENGKVEKVNRTSGSDDWVWGVEETTITSPTIDDRAAFSGDKCSTGMVRFRGMCVPED